MRHYSTSILSISLLMLGGLESTAIAHTNQAEVGISTTLKQISVTVTQHEAPKQGNCLSGFSWLPQFGGCTKQETEFDTDTVACPSGYQGTQSRSKSRTRYTVQYNGAVSYGEWSYANWNTAACRQVPESIYSMPDADRDALIARSTFLVTAKGGSDVGSKALASLIYDPVYGRIYCYQRWNGNDNENGQGSFTVILGQGGWDQQIRQHSSCSTNGTSGTVWGDCERTSGGDEDRCLAGSKHYP